MITKRFMAQSRILWLLSILLLAQSIASTHAQTSLTGYKLPTKEVKLDAAGVERVNAARTVAILADAVPLMRAEGKSVIVTYRDGRVGGGRAKADVEKVLAEWGAFDVVDDPAEADLVFVIEELTLAPSFMSDGKVRLRETLAVFPTGGPGTAAPLWVGIETENALAAASGLTRPDAEGVVKRFRRDVERTRQKE